MISSLPERRDGPGRAFFEELKSVANGMLPAEVYARIYDVGRESGGGTFVEIGTAHGAASIALAKGAQDGGEPFHLYTVDPFGGALSSRSAYGTVEQNVKIVRDNYAHFGLADDITICVGSVATILEQYELEAITVLVLDADGRIDRDLTALGDLLVDGCPVVVDDVDGQLYLGSIGGRRILDQKHRIGRLLTDAFVEAGLLRRGEQIGGTGFFAKGVMDVRTISATAIPAYRELVFADLDDAVTAGAPAWRRFARDHVPFARTLCDRVRRRA